MYYNNYNMAQYEIQKFMYNTIHKTQRNVGLIKPSNIFFVDINII